MDLSSLKNYDLALYFLGKRDYVNGLTLFEEMLKPILADFRSIVSHPTYIKLFKVNNFIRTHAWVEVYRTRDIKYQPKLKMASARIDFLSDKDDYTLLLFEKSDKRVTKRVEDYDRGVYVAEYKTLGDKSTVAKLAHLKNTFDLVRGIVEVNHRYVTKESGKMDIYGGAFFAYLTCFPFLSESTVSGVDMIHFDFKNIVYAHERRFLTRTVRIEGVKNVHDTEICFFTDIPETERNESN